jgi:hypothetical protein
MSKPEAIVDLVALEIAYLALWRHVHHLNTELERSADIQKMREALKTALDQALADYTQWRVAKQVWEREPAAVGSRGPF